MFLETFTKQQTNLSTWIELASDILTEQEDLKLFSISNMRLVIPIANLTQWKMFK